MPGTEQSYHQGQTPRVRVLIAKPGLDGHDRGAKIVSQALRNAGMEVIYTGLRQTPEKIVAAALQEDADVVGLSIHSGAHMVLFPRVASLLKESGMSHVLLLAGGMIPDEDVPRLKEMGFRAIFPPETPLGEIVDVIRSNIQTKRGETANP